MTQALALPLFVKGVEKDSTWEVAAAEEERAVEGRYWLARIVDQPYQNPQEFMYCGERFEIDYYMRRYAGCGAFAEELFDRIKRRTL